MKHKRKKSSRREHKHKSKKKKKEVNKPKSDKAKESRIKSRLKRLAMASGFQGAVSASVSSSYAADESDDIIVVYDKLEETNRKRETAKKQLENKVDLTKQFEVNLKDIPLPPETWVNPFKKLNDAKSLPFLPSPSSPKVFERLKDVSLSEDDFTAEELSKLINEFRKWELTDVGETMQKQGYCKSNAFTVMSYNVLAQELLELHHYLYRKHDTKALQWENRSKILLKEIKEADADILCLQEVQANQLGSFYKNLNSLGYKGVYKQRSVNNFDGCAIYYKSSKFNLVHCSTVEYFQDYLPNTSVLDRHNVAIIVRLAFQDSVGFSDLENQIVVATTHLLYNPRRHDVRLAQSQVLLAELDRVSYIGKDKSSGKPSYLPVIVTGDFNLQPHSAVHRLLVDGRLHYSELSARSLMLSSHGQPRQERLLPFELQISNYCQHLGLLPYRLKQGNNCSKIEHVDPVALTKLYSSELNTTPEQFWHGQSGWPLLYEEDFYGRTQKGVLCHSLNLQSVYKHQRQSSTSGRMTYEATTNQNNWVTVDYIFYSGQWNHCEKRIEEGRLKLLSRYTLPTCGQCQQLKTIPNLACGSDHLFLMAHFLLKE